jgi:hypothetical protein
VSTTPGAGQHDQGHEAESGAGQDASGAGANGHHRRHREAQVGDAEPGAASSGPAGTPPSSTAVSCQAAAGLTRNAPTAAPAETKIRGVRSWRAERTRVRREIGISRWASMVSAPGRHDHRHEQSHSLGVPGELADAVGGNRVGHDHGDVAAAEAVDDVLEVAGGRRAR